MLVRGQEERWNKTGFEPIIVEVDAGHIRHITPLSLLLVMFETSHAT